MANAVLQIRTDQDVKTRCDSLFKDLGITISDAVNIFLRQCLACDGLPFQPTREKKINVPNDILAAMKKASESAIQNGVSEMTLDEINAEISLARQGK